MAEFTYEVTERIAVLSTNARGWERQLNMVSWNGKPRRSTTFATGPPMAAAWPRASA